MAKTDPWIPGNIPTSSKVYRTGGGQYGGYAVRETSGSAGATVRLWDNATAASGVLLDTIALTSGASLSKEMKWGVRAMNGIYVEVVSGAIEGCILTN